MVKMDLTLLIYDDKTNTNIGPLKFKTQLNIFPTTKYSNTFMVSYLDFSSK